MGSDSLHRFYEFPDPVLPPAVHIQDGAGRQAHPRISKEHALEALQPVRRHRGVVINKCYDLTPGRPYSRVARDFCWQIGPKVL